ncbi:MAG: GNAT family N-acetyltransferase [Actinomadura rubrobrunea]|nr:GNAT family N-acetyltransferase [Actinomadura rubrobrunea]
MTVAPQARVAVAESLIGWADFAGCITWRGARRGWRERRPTAGRRRGQGILLSAAQGGPRRLRRRDLGARLIGDLLDEAERRGVPVVLDVLVVNRRAYALYERLGFREVGRHGDGDIKIRMRREPSGR